MHKALDKPKLDEAALVALKGAHTILRRERSERLLSEPGLSDEEEKFQQYFLGEWGAEDAED